LDGAGNLLINFKQGTIKESPPIAWQIKDNKKHPINVTYHLFSNHALGFKVDHFDPAYPLIIDPSLTWNTFLGGNVYDGGNGVILDNSGNI